MHARAEGLSASRYWLTLLRALACVLAIEQAYGCVQMAMG
jgi:hypothetical protein